VKRVLKKYRGELILTGVSFFSIIFTLMLNYGNSKLRIAEISNIMSESVTSSQDIDHAGLIVQYRFRLELYGKKLTELEADIIEMKAAAMFPRILNTDNLLTGGITIRLSTLMVNTIKSLLGKPPLILRNNAPGNSALGSAYYYERNSLFSKALEKYEEALRHEPRSGQKGGIMLHQGFCLSMTGSIDKAINKYTEVMGLYPDAPVSVTASILLEFLKKFSSEADIIKKMPDSPEKMEKLFRLIAFNDSLEVLENINKKQKTENKAVLSFFKARCLESAGRAPEALAIYQDIITQNPSSEQAKFANRRILIISLKSYHGGDGKRLAVKNNSAIRDKTLEYFINSIQKVQSLFHKNTGTVPVLYSNEIKASIADSEKRTDSLTCFLGKKIKITTANGNIIIGTATYEDDLKIKVSTIVGEAVIMKNDIKKSEIR